MSQPRSRFGRTFMIVSAVHVMAIVIVGVVSAVRGCSRDRTTVEIPVEFLVMPASQAEAAAVEQPQPAPPVEPVRPEPTPPKPKPKPRPRPEINRSTERVTRDVTPRTKPQPLSAEEIAKRLARGAQLGDRNSHEPGEDARCDLLVHRAFYRVWVAPSRDAVGDAVAKISIRLAAGGQVVGRDLVKSSGNAELDRSVLQAANAVKRIEGLTAGYLRRSEIVVIPFRVE